MSNPSSHETPESRSKILRDVLAFQVKLWLEGFKDVVLMPLSLGAAFVDLLFQPSTKRGTLYTVMKLGDRFERWVDLYAAIDDKHDPSSPHRSSLDDLMDETEAGLRNGSSSQVRETNPEHERS